jgi:hypothetical protein
MVDSKSDPAETACLLFSAFDIVWSA